MTEKQYCERALYLERRGIDTKVLCNCTGNLDCTALPELRAILNQAAGCCEVGYPKDVSD